MVDATLVLAVTGPVADESSHRGHHVPNDEEEQQSCSTSLFPAHTNTATLQVEFVQ